MASVSIPFPYRNTGYADSSKTGENFSAILTYLNSTIGGGVNTTLSNLTDVVAINKKLNNFSAGTITADNLSNLGYLDMAAIANPAAPAAGTARFHAATTQGFTRFEQDNEAATNLVLGRDNVFIAKNTTVSTITKGQCVYVTGSTGNVPNIGLAKADSLTTLPAIGIALDNINANNFGQVMKLGILASFNTSGFLVGAQVYVDATTAGALTATRPSNPNYVQRVGSVLVSGVGNGSLLITVAPFIGNRETGTTENYTFGGTATVTGALYVGSGTSTNSVDSVVTVNRAVNDSTAGNGHSFSDSSTISRSGVIGYNSFDGRFIVTGSANYDHFAIFQSNPLIGTSGTTSNVYGIYSKTRVNTGTLTNSYSFYASDTYGSGTVTNNYGLYVEQLTNGATLNYAVYTAGTTPSVFTGNVGFGGVPSYPIHIIGTGDKALVIETATAGSDDNFISFKYSGTEKAWIGFATHSTDFDIHNVQNGALALFTNNINRLNISGTGTVAISNLTANRAVTTGASSVLVSSATTDTEIGYVSGVTSAIQTQFTGKASTALSNLASVAINTTLVSDTNNTDDLGTTTVGWKNLYLTGSILNGTTTCITTSSSGYVTQPVQPSFLAYNSATDSDVTGDGTEYTVIFDTEVRDRTSAYNNSTGVFTAQITGDYLLNARVLVSGLTTATTQFELKIVTSNRTYNNFELHAPANGDYKECELTVVADMDINDTAYVVIRVTNGTKVVDVNGTTDPMYTTFSGSLIN